MSPEGQERWLPISGHPSYEVSDQGRVRSVDRIETNTLGHRTRRLGRVLTGYIQGSSQRYFAVTLCAGPVKTPRYIHQLVLETFVGSRPPEMEARHLDGCPTNNALANLRWGTKSENGFDLVRHGTHHMARRSHCPRGHLLGAPNLRNDYHRACLACSRGRTALSNARRAGRPASGTLQEISDAYYAELLRKAA